mmetsp:Transcript_7998/g.18825  ORF Transcript_7998/g.18825 Transcript_7998/m.18825 type:complete len:272 (-) Transcript_7998:7-822(-)
MPTGSAPSINAPVFQLPSFGGLCSRREACPTPHRHAESLRHQHHLYRPLPRVAQQGERDLIAFRLADKLNEVTHWGIFAICAVDGNHLVTLKHPHATTRLVVDADSPVELISISVYNHLSDANAPFLRELLQLHAQRLGNGDIKYCLVAPDPLHLSVPLRSRGHSQGRGFVLPRPRSPGCPSSHAKCQRTNKRRSELCCGQRLPARPRIVSCNSPTQTSHRGSATQKTHRRLPQNKNNSTSEAQHLPVDCPGSHGQGYSQGDFRAWDTGQA